jgi:flagellar protein FlaF
MHSAMQAYAKTAQKTASPRELESQLLLRAASKLQAICDGRVTDQGGIAEALIYTRRLWAVLLSSITRPDNPLPVEIKQNLANLGGFIIKRTLSAEVIFSVEKIEPLIGLNREIAAGLRGVAPVASVQQAS